MNLDRGAGAIFTVDEAIAEPVSDAPGKLVRANAKRYAAPSRPVQVWDPASSPPKSDTACHRPFAGMARDPRSGNLLICGYSGVDLPNPPAFSKNATDSVFRFDPRDAHWHVVEQHLDPEGRGGKGPNVDTTDYYPLTQSGRPPHGWLAGPESVAVIGDHVYIGTLDNDRVVRYPLRAIRQSAQAPAPSAEPLLDRSSQVPGFNGEVRGPSGFAYLDGHLYVAYRTSRVVVRFPVPYTGLAAVGIQGELVADFSGLPDNPNLVDLIAHPSGDLLLSTASLGGVWRFSSRAQAPFIPRSIVPNFVDLRQLTGNRETKCSNIAMDGLGRLYICSNNDDAGDGTVAGTLYRASPSAIA